MSSHQLNFDIRTSSSVKTVHLLGSWDGYHGQLPLKRDSARSSTWRGTFRFPNTALKAGQRYWYYYSIDGYRSSHDPSKPSVIEQTTWRTLNILDVSSHGTDSSAPPLRSSEYRQSSYTTHDRQDRNCLVQGRSLSPSKIESPYPLKPYATRKIVNNDRYAPVDVLSRRLANTSLPHRRDSSLGRSDSSDIDSDVPSLGSYSSRSGGSSPGTVFSSGSSSASSRSSDSGSARRCTCECYGVTRGGDRVKLDCGGARCGANFSSDGSSCSSDSEGDYKTRRKTALAISSSQRYSTREYQPRGATREYQPRGAPLRSSRRQ